MSRNDSLKKGKNNIEMILLSILIENDYYGYQLSQLVTEYSQELLSIPEGSLYPALYRLLDNGYISDERRQIGKRLTRVYYHIEPAGREYLETLLFEYNRLNTAIQNILFREQMVGKEKKGIKSMQKSTKKYLRNIRFAFPVFRRNERRFYADFKASVCDYETQNPNCTSETLSDNFGIPKEVVIDYFNEMESASYLSLMRRSFYPRTVALAAIILMLSYFCLNTYSLYQAHKSYTNSIIKTEATTIVYTE